MEFGKPDHEETEEEIRARHDREEFESKLDRLPQNVQDRYYKLLEVERNKRIEKMKQEGKTAPEIIGIDERKVLLNEAGAATSFGVDPIKMERDFERFGHPNKGSEPSEES